MGQNVKIECLDMCNVDDLKSELAFFVYVPTNWGNTRIN